MIYKSDALTSKLESIAVEVVTMAAISCFDQIGMNNNEEADRQAVEMARFVLNSQLISGVVKIGEGERDNAPMLYSGEIIGQGGERVDIAIDPLEGTNLCSKDQPGAITAVAISKEDGMQMAPDIYMDKIATCKNIGPDAISLSATTEENVTRLAKALEKNIADLRICLLNRDRNAQKIKELRELGVEPILISDGDITAIINTHSISDKFDLYFGIGGAPEGVLSASFVNATEGFMQGRFVAADAAQEQKAKSFGIDLDRVYQSRELVSQDSIFAAAMLTKSIIKGTHKLQKTGDNTFKVSILIANSVLSEVRIVEKNINPQIRINSVSAKKKLSKS